MIRFLILLVLATARISHCGRAQGKLSVKAFELNTTSSTIFATAQYGDQKWRGGQGEEFAGLLLNGNFKSGHARLAIFKPDKVENGEYSGAFLSVEAGDGATFNGIALGWIVNPSLYGDSDVHFSVTTRIQMHLKLGALLTPSTLGEEQNQNFLDVYIGHNKNDGKWYLYANKVEIGHWENNVFDSIKDYATRILIGGEVYTPSDKDSSPAMGSGQFHFGNKAVTCYAEDILVNQDTFGVGGNIPQNPEIRQSRCYFVEVGSSRLHGFGFFSGGKGGIEGKECVYPGGPPLPNK